MIISEAMAKMRHLKAIQDKDGYKFQCLYWDYWMAVLLSLGTHSHLPNKARQNVSTGAAVLSMVIHEFLKVEPRIIEHMNRIFDDNANHARKIRAS